MLPLFLQAFIATSLIFGDGLYNLVKVSATLIGERLRTCGTEQTSIPVKEDFGGKYVFPTLSEDLKQQFSVNLFQTFSGILCSEYSCLSA